MESALRPCRDTSLEKGVSMIAVGVSVHDRDREVGKLLDQALDVAYAVPRVYQGRPLLPRDEVGDDLLELAWLVEGVDFRGKLVDLEPGEGCLDLLKSLPRLAGQALIPFPGDDEVFSVLASHLG